MNDAQAELRALEADLAGVERALARLDDGSHGTCEVCGAPVDDLLAVRCPAHP